MCENMSVSSRNLEGQILGSILHFLLWQIQLSADSSPKIFNWNTLPVVVIVELPQRWTGPRWHSPGAKCPTALWYLGLLQLLTISWRQVQARNSASICRIRTWNRGTLWNMGQHGPTTHAPFWMRKWWTSKSGDSTLIQPSKCWVESWLKRQKSWDLSCKNGSEWSGMIRTIKRRWRRSAFTRGWARRRCPQKKIARSAWDLARL